MGHGVFQHDGGESAGGEPLGHLMALMADGKAAVGASGANHHSRSRGFAVGSVERYERLVVAVEFRIDTLRSALSGRGPQFELGSLPGGEGRHAEQRAQGKKNSFHHIFRL